MSDELNTITAQELKAYLGSLDKEETEEKAKQINIYEEECLKKQKAVRTKDIERIQKAVSEEYLRRNQTKDKILSLLNECKSIPENIEEIEISRYMVYRVDIKSAEKILTKAIKRLNKKFKKNLEEILELIEIYPLLKSVEEIDASIYKTNSNLLERAKEEFAEEYSQEQKMKLIEKELDIIAKAKIFNSTPIPYEILKTSDREIQSKMPKFNSIRQKRINILSTMERDYLKLTEPREINCMIDDAILNIDSISSILTDREYKRAKNKLIRRRKKIFRNSNEIRDIIKSKEKRTGINNYNIQEARYERMNTLKNKIDEATKIIKLNNTDSSEKELKKLKASYEKEKQFASVINNLMEENESGANSNISMLEERINSIENKIKNCKKTIKEQEEILSEAKKELIVLWKIEIDNTISNKKEDMLELAEDNHEVNLKNKRTNLFGLKKQYKAKHELV